MATGLQVFDASGREIFGGADRVARYLGEYRNSGRGISASKRGAFTVPLSSGAKVWFYVVTDPERVGNYSTMPRFSQQGNVISWEYIGGTFNIPFTMTYGEY